MTAHPSMPAAPVQLRDAPIAIVGALHAELSALLALLPAAQCQRVGGRDYWLAHWHGQPVVAVACGVGKVCAAAAAAVLASRFGARAIVFSGTAGGVGEGVRVGDVVVPDELVQHDMDASPLFARFEVPLYGQSHFAAHPRLAAALAQAARQVLGSPAQALGDAAVRGFGLHAPQVHTGLLASGDRFIATPEAAHALRRDLPGLQAVEMEGAAVAQVCHDWALPFAALRTISDHADHRAAHDFSRFLDSVASRYTAAIVGALLAQWPLPATTGAKANSAG